MKRLAAIVREIKAAREEEQLTFSEIGFSLWVEVGALIFLRTEINGILSGDAWRKA